jgi:hypothetical protein
VMDDGASTSDENTVCTVRGADRAVAQFPETNCRRPITQQYFERFSIYSEIKELTFLTV